jgi:oligoribonuclease
VKGAIAWVDCEMTGLAKSGLLAVLDDGIPLAEASALLLQYTRKHLDDVRSVPLAGNSVWVDRRFLARDMPSFEQEFSHRIIDVSSVAELVTRWRPEAITAMPERSTQHRALADIGDSISELGVYRRLLFPDPPAGEAARATSGSG